MNAQEEQYLQLLHAWNYPPISQRPSPCCLPGDLLPPVLTPLTHHWGQPSLRPLQPWSLTDPFLLWPPSPTSSGPRVSKTPTSLCQVITNAQHWIFSCSTWVHLPQFCSVLRDTPDTSGLSAAAAGSAGASRCQDQMLCMWWSFALAAKNAASTKCTGAGRDLDHAK